MNGNTALTYQETRGEEPRGQEPQPGTEPTRATLFPGNERESFHGRWQSIQGEFVDEPRHAVEQADQLVSTVIGRLSEVFAGERERIEREWPKTGEVSTEDLRQTLRRYRAFFDRLLAL